jgi:hypothetical protein
MTPGRLSTGLALALTAVLAAAGCSATPARPPSAAGGTARAVPARATAPGAAGAGALTQALAWQVFRGYTAAADRAARTGDKRLALSLVTGVQRTVLAAVLRFHRVTISDSSPSGAYSSTLTVTPSLSPESYRNPVFYLPEVSGYPRFFAARVTRTAGGTALMVFEQAAESAPWLLASVSRLAAGTAVPKLAGDGGGRVPAVAPSAAGLLVPPGSVGALQAAVVDDGPVSAAARAVAAGPLTTGMYTGAADHADGLRAPRGDAYQWELTGTALPVFALRTAGGGALAFYAMSLTETVAVPDMVTQAEPVRSGPPIQVPVSLMPLLPQGQQAPLIELQSQQLLSFAAVDPPGADGKIQVIAVGGGLTAAAAT